MSAIICALLFYSGAVKTQKTYSLKTLIPKNEINFITGKICSNPVKQSSSFSSESFYSADFDVFEVSSKKNYVSQAKGKVKIFIPARFVEAFYPGKLYTLSKNKSAAVFESGSQLKLNVNAFAKSEEDIFFVNSAEKLKTETTNLFSKAEKFRAVCRLQFKRLMFSWGKAGGLFLALLSGSKEYIENDIAQAFKNAGLSHILALSGMHLSVFAGSIAFIKKLVSKKIFALLNLSLIVVFLWFAGLTPSLLRAFLFTLIFSAASLLRLEKPHPLNALSLTFLIHCVIKPSDIQSASFILSYGALTGIFVIGSVLRFFLNKIVFQFVSNPICDSAGAQIFTMPVTAFMFKKIIPAGIAASVIVSPLITLFLYTGFLGVILCLLLPFLSDVFCFAMTILYESVKIVVLFFASFKAISL